MRYSSALVLGALAASQATAHSIRHAGFHARRHAESKRDINDVDWSSVTYDLSDISQEEWASIFASQNGAAPTPTPSPAAPAPAVTSSAVVEVAAAPSKVEASPTAEKPAATTTASSDDSDDSDLGDVIGDIMAGVGSFLKTLGAQAGANSETSNGGAWIGDDSNWKMNMKNGGSESIYVFCWKKDNAWINANQPDISIHLGGGQSQTISFAEGFSGSCASAGNGIDKLEDGLIPNTWAEVTFTPTYGTYDVSRLPNMQGQNLSMKGSQCTSDMETCVFKCPNGEKKCIAGYILENCSAANGGGTGVDYGGNGGASGGCMMGADGETIDVTFG